MKNYLGVLSVLIFHVVANADQIGPVNFSCRTMPASTTTMSAVTRLKEGPSVALNIVEFSVVHENGVAYLPLHSGSISPKDIDKINLPPVSGSSEPYLVRKYKLFSKLGDAFNIEFPISACSTSSTSHKYCTAKNFCQEHDLEQIMCIVDSSVKIGNTKIQGMAAVKTDYLTVVDGDVFSETKVTFSFKVSDQFYGMEMNYNTADCN